MTFLSTLSLRRATSETMPGIRHVNYFYPRSPCGERHRNIAHCERQKNISIHALLAESDFNSFSKKDRQIIFLSTLSLRRATTHPIGVLVRVVFLSTLSLRRATQYENQRSDGLIFLSTLSLRRATQERFLVQSALLFLSTLSLRRATVQNRPRPSAGIFLSTLSLRRATSDPEANNRTEQPFLSTLSLRRATSKHCEP